MKLTKQATKMKKWECRQDVDLTKASFDSNVITGCRHQELNIQNLWNIC